MELKDAIPEIRIVIIKTEINVLKALEKDLIEMNNVEHIDFGFIRTMFAEYISGREYEIEQIKK